MSVALCQKEVSSEEFIDWQVYAEMEPFGWEPFQLALLLTMFANVYRKKGARRAKMEDFLPSGGSKPKLGSKQLNKAWSEMMEGFTAFMKERPKVEVVPRE